MLQAWTDCSGVDAHEQIGFAIADMLESVETLDEDGPIARMAGSFGARTFATDSPGMAKLRARLESRRSSDTDFAALVMGSYGKAVKTSAGAQSSVWQGSPFSVDALAKRFLQYIVSPTFDMTQQALTVALRQRFEANTGVECSGFYRDGKFVQGEAVHTLEAFLLSHRPDEYAAGRRYFFGHLLG